MTCHQAALHLPVALDRPLAWDGQAASCFSKEVSCHGLQSTDGQNGRDCIAYEGHQHLHMKWVLHLYSRAKAPLG